MRKVLVVIALVFFGGACADTSTPDVQIGQAQTIERDAYDRIAARGTDMEGWARYQVNALSEGAGIENDCLVAYAVGRWTADELVGQMEDSSPQIVAQAIIQIEQEDQGLC